MSTYLSTATPAELAARIAAARSLVVVTHAKPDGDAMGSVLALVRAARACHVPAHGLLVGPVDGNLLALARPDELHIHREGDALPDAELIAVVDTGSWSQVEPLGQWLREHQSRVIGVDHHARGEDVARCRLVDSTAASATQVLITVIDAMGAPLTAGADERGSFGIAEALFAGLATDTGWFQFSSANEPVFHLAGRLLGAGANKQRIIEQLEHNERPPRLAATGIALRSIRWLAQGRAVLMNLTLNDIAATGAAPEDLGGIVNVPMSVGTVVMSILATEVPGGMTKVSFRSKPRGCGSPWYDVNELAASFGGGGHVQAAGARIVAPHAEALDRLATAVEALSATPS